jgi:pyridoxamine 5'-phosphate oxidase
MTDSNARPPGLSPDMLAADPIDQFAQWMKEAEVLPREVLPEPNAMVLATVSADGLPRARTVLLKDFGADGFTFYTNRTSRKGQDLAVHPNATVVFPWYVLQRQVTVEGSVTLLTQEQSEPYYRSRPRGSQLGAWASRQSTVLESREQLDQRAVELDRRWPEGTSIPMPDFWGGYLITPSIVEFWQSGRYRLHDRLRYQRDGSGWVIERLSPLPRSQLPRVIPPPVAARHSIIAGGLGVDCARPHRYDGDVPPHGLRA